MAQGPRSVADPSDGDVTKHILYHCTGYYASPATRLYLAVFLLIGTVCRGFLVCSVAIVLF